jgi:2-polyprenyl-3-methyl-5-hydroxy-6-metoxy-1,4-benzoquinol methylase
MENDDELEKIALSYMSSNDPTFQVDERVLAILAKRVVPLVQGPTVLEMGIGENVWTQHVIDKFSKTFAVDGSKKLLEEAEKKYGPYITTFYSYFENFDPGIQFDSVLATMVLEHVDDPVTVLRQIKKYTKPESQIMVMVPNANSVHRIYGACLGFLKSPDDLSESDHKLGHRRVYTSSVLEKDCHEAGLKIKARYPTLIKFLSNSQMKDFTDHQLEGLFLLAEKMPVEYSAHLFYECTPA